MSGFIWLTGYHSAFPNLAVRAADVQAVMRHPAGLYTYVWTGPGLHDCFAVQESPIDVVSLCDGVARELAEALPTIPTMTGQVTP